MAEHTIDLKVNVDAREAETLKPLPDEVRPQSPPRRLEDEAAEGEAIHHTYGALF